jgi:thymidylate synthase ThyX
MKVTHASIRPTQAAIDAGRPSLTPELLASVGAKYSRSDDGLEHILSKIDENNPDKAIDTIFAHVDYGHQSIADMVPVAMFMDEVSIFLAYFLWTETTIGSGQESSTRYIKMDIDGVMPFESTGLPAEQKDEWVDFIKKSFETYDKAYNFWIDLAVEDPTLMKIPKSLIDDTSAKAQKQVARMRNNYAFDRARYFLPVAALTNVMIIQSAREWARLANILNSHHVPEFNMLGKMIEDEMALVCPRMCRHTKESESTKLMIAQEFEITRTFRCGLAHGLDLADDCSNSEEFFYSQNSTYSADPSANVTIFEDASPHVGSVAQAAATRTNRYSLFGSAIKRTSVRFSWDAVAFAEIRDLNRHRTGYKWCPISPQGFYCAMEQVPHTVFQDSYNDDAPHFMFDFEVFGIHSSIKAAKELWNRTIGYEYWTLLGTQYYFEHTTQLDKFIYEGELRTGVGAHYRYAKHLRDALYELYQLKPELKYLVMEGQAEPE